MLQEYSFQKQTQYLQGNNVLDAASSNKDGSFGEIHVFFQLRSIDLFEENETLPSLKTMIHRNYSFQKLSSHRQAMC
jgi:hypothetical protein